MGDTKNPDKKELKEAERLAKEKSRQKELAWKEAERLAKEKARQEEKERKEAEKLAKEKAKQEEKEAERARLEAERLAKEKARQEEKERKEAEKLAVEKTLPVAPAVAEVPEVPAETGKEPETAIPQETKPVDVLEDLPAEEAAEGNEQEEPAVEEKDLYKGKIKLVIEPPVGLNLAADIEKRLRQVENLRLVMVGGSGGGVQLVLSADEPVPLLDILRDMSLSVEAISKKGNEIKARIETGKQ